MKIKEQPVPHYHCHEIQNMFQDNKNETLSVP